MKSFLLKIKNWWQNKNILGRMLTVVAFLSVLCICSLGGLFLSVYMKDVSRRKAKQMASEEELLKTAIVEDGVTYVKKSGIVTFLFLGIDTRTESEVVSNLQKYEGASQVAGQSDAIMLIAYDMDNSTVKVINIPRDSMVYIQTYTRTAGKGIQAYEQIALQYAFGRSDSEAAKLVKDIISEQIFVNLDIDYYAALNYVAIPKIVDDIGGLDITMSGDYDIYVFTDDGGIEPRHYDAGQTYHLFGYDAAGIVHYRDIEVYGSAMDRIERQKDFIRALFHDGKETVRDNPALITAVYGDIKDNLNTDLTLSDIISLASTMINVEFSTDDIVILPGELGTELAENGKDYHQTYELDMDGVRRIMLDTWYVPLDDIR